MNGTSRSISIVFSRTSSEPLIVRQSGTTTKQLGEVVKLAPIPNALHRFDAQGKPMMH